jgi:hypothetical protein
VSNAPPSPQSPQEADPQPRPQAPQADVSQPSRLPSQGPPSEKAFEAKSFLRSLYDFSFSSLITLRVIRALYVLITILYTLGAIITFVSLIVEHTVITIIIAIVGVPIGYFIYLTIARIALEVLMVVFNIGKDVRAIRERGEAGA